MPAPQVAVRLDGVVIARPTVEDVPAYEGTENREARPASQYAQVQIGADLSVFDGAVSDALKAIAEVRSQDVAAFTKLGVGEQVSMIVVPYTTWTPKRGNGRSFNIVRYRFISLAPAASATGSTRLAAASA